MNFPEIYFAQCWEDADIVMEALDIDHNSICLSIASGGENTLAMLVQNPRKVIAVDNNPSQIACLELKVAGFRTLTHQDLLALIGSIDTSPLEREKLYQKCRNQLSKSSQDFWDDNLDDIHNGIGRAGKIEKRFQKLANSFIYLCHNQNTINQFFSEMTTEERKTFYQQKWNNWRWKLLFYIFFSTSRRKLRWGKEKDFFAQLAKDLEKMNYNFANSCINLSPRDNPYLQWMLTQQHKTALPYALRPENFETIRNNLDRLEWHCLSINDFLDSYSGEPIDKFNISNLADIKALSYSLLLEKILAHGKKRSRIANWYLFSYPHKLETLIDSEGKPLSHKIAYLQIISEDLFTRNKILLYRAFSVLEIK